MVEDKEYLDFLEKIIACINHSDYEAVKELSNLKLEKFKKKRKKKQKNTKYN